MTDPRTQLHYWLDATEHVADVEAMCAQYLGIDDNWAFAFALIPMPFHDAIVAFAQGKLKKDAEVMAGYINKKVPQMGNVFECRMVPLQDFLNTLVAQPNYVIKAVSRAPEQNLPSSLVIFAPPSLREPQHGHNKFAKLSTEDVERRSSS